MSFHLGLGLGLPRRVRPGHEIFFCCLLSAFALCDIHIPMR